MTSRLRLASRGCALAGIVVASLGATNAGHGFVSTLRDRGMGRVTKPRAESPEATEALFRGDMSADTALGCGGPGPTEWATKVTATLMPSFGVVATTYSVATNSGPTWDLVAWNNGASPGSEIQRCPLGAANGTAGPHTVSVPVGCLTIPAAAGQTFYFGLSQGTDTNPMSAPMDTSGSTPATVFIRAPGCGLANFASVESIGFPGFWVHRIIVDDTVPVELMRFGVE
jgi:hypothetical protein